MLLGLSFIRLGSQQSFNLLTCAAEEHTEKVIYIIEMTSKHSKEAINSALKCEILTADVGTLSVPFNHRQEVKVLLQHSR